MVIFSAGQLALLLVLAGILSLVLGMGMPTVGVYILLALLAAPAYADISVTDSGIVMADESGGGGDTPPTEEEEEPDCE